MSPLHGRMTEAELLAALTRCAREQGWLAYHPWSSLHSAKGWPDLVLARELTLVVWELKNDTAKPTPEQVAWLDWWQEFADAAWEASGAIDPSGTPRAPLIHVALVRPADLEAAYWLLMGQKQSPEHQWPAEWVVGKRERVA